MGRRQGPEGEHNGPHNSQSLIIGKLNLRDMFPTCEILQENYLYSELTLASPEVVPCSTL